MLPDGRHFAARRPCWLYAIRRRGPAQLYPVRDGVILPPLGLKDRIDFVVLADVSPLTSDLTGLQVVEDEAYQLLLGQMRKLI